MGLLHLGHSHVCYAKDLSTAPRSLPWVGHKTPGPYISAVLLFNTVHYHNPPMILIVMVWLLTATIATCVNGNVVTRCPLKTKYCCEMRISFYCFSKYQAPSQYNINYWAGTSKSISKFQCRLQLLTCQINCDPSIHHFEPKRFAWGLSTALSRLLCVSTCNTEVFCDLHVL